MLFDLHAHSSGISHCCRIPAEEVIHRALAVGLDGIVLTNHYQDLRNYFNGGSCDDFARRYVAERYNWTYITEKLRALTEIVGK